MCPIHGTGRCRGAGIAADIVPMRQRSETSKAQRFEASHRPASLVALPISTRTCHRSSPCLEWSRLTPPAIDHDRRGQAKSTLPSFIAERSPCLPAKVHFWPRRRSPVNRGRYRWHKLVSDRSPYPSLSECTRHMHLLDLVDQSYIQLALLDPVLHHLRCTPHRLSLMSSCYNPLRS